MKLIRGAMKVIQKMAATLKTERAGRSKMHCDACNTEEQCTHNSGVFPVHWSQIPHQMGGMGGMAVDRLVSQGGVLANGW